ncbi:MAG: inositol monophosphatase [Proteobacteria bacterium]|nr:inositol monophosphatase [Pseudomonadota bacterium]
MTSELERISEIARAAGSIQMEHLGGQRRVEHKDAWDIVTDVDRMCEEFIVSEMRKSFPGDDILAEEGERPSGKASRRWIIDPLDGTINYSHGIPIFCLAIASEVGGDITSGVIYDPNRDEIFSAERGQGARLNGRRTAVSATASMDRALLATGFAYSVHREDGLTNLDNFGRFARRAQAVRRPGSASIDQAWVACGRVDGFWEMFLKPWDMAAGACIIAEAGGRVTAFDGSPFDLYGTEILASNGRLHEGMIQVLKKRDS